MTYWNLDAWQESRALAKEVYEVTNAYPKRETYGLCAQLRSAVVSIASNIAEGQGRWSLKEQCRFYYIARGSLMELETQLILSMDFGYIDEATRERLMQQTAKIARKVNALISSAKKRSEIRDP